MLWQRKYSDRLLDLVYASAKHIRDRIHKVSQQQFAIKVMDADAVDIRANAKFRDESIKEFLHETKVLQKLAGAPNVNQIFDVMEVEAQLWIISEYVPGGSVKTLVSPRLQRLFPNFFHPTEVSRLR